MVKKILFICKYNRFRSKIAEYFFNKYNKNPRYVAKSAGIIRGAPVDLKEKKMCRKYDIILKDPTQGLSTNLLKWQDTTIIVANDVPASIFKDNKRNGKELIVWKIPDTKSDNEARIKKIIEMIRNKITRYVGRLK